MIKLLICLAGVGYVLRLARPDGFFFQAEDGIRDLVRSRGLGDVYKRQVIDPASGAWTRLTQGAGNDRLPDWKK